MQIKSMLVVPLGALLAASGTIAAPPPPPPPPSKSLDVRPLIREVDTDHDGCITEKEWFAAGLPKLAYDMLKDGRGCVTEARMHEVPPAPGVDLNHDGMLTAEELREYEKIRVKAGPPPGPAPDGR